MGTGASDLERQIDELYQRPLTEFTAARNAVAKSLATAGAKSDAERVKALTKPTVVPWAVNQVYWRARSIWDRLIASGQSRRARQLATLSGQPVTPGRPGKGAGRVDGLGRADEDFEGAHRQAIADAVHQAVRAAADAGVQPGADQLTRMLEAISLAASLPESPGRFTEVVQPAGFEALLGVTIAPLGPRPAVAILSSQRASPVAKPTGARTTPRAAQARPRVDPAHAARVMAASAALDNARRNEDTARRAETAATEAMHDAELRLKQARAALADAQTAAQAATAAREEAEQTLLRLEGGEASSGTGNP